MRYVSLMLAMGVPCSRNSVGIWNIPRETFIKEFDNYTLESDDMPMGSLGIEKTRLVPGKEDQDVYVADHVRAYCDMLYMGEFDTLKGLFSYAIKDMKCRQDIFVLVYRRLSSCDGYDEIEEFMRNEFGAVWASYMNTVKLNSSYAERYDVQLERDDERRKRRYGEIIKEYEEVYVSPDNILSDTGNRIVSLMG